MLGPKHPTLTLRFSRQGRVGAARRTISSADEPHHSEEVYPGAHAGFVITEVGDLNEIPQPWENPMAPLKKRAVSLCPQTACHGGLYPGAQSI
jgi:hypothetical protein